MLTPIVQRWRDHRSSYRPAREVIDIRNYEVAPIPERDARLFVEQHHYAGTMPAARFTFGLLNPLLVGVCVFSHPVNDRVFTNILPGAAIENTELGRLVLLDAVPANAESFFVAQCFHLLRRKGLVGVLSFSDPVPRTTAAGETLFKGHVGTVYQALNAVYTGRGKARTLRLLPDGTVFSERAMSKVRSGERGMVYAAQQLIQAGAPKVPIEHLSEEERRAWLRAAVESVTRPLKHAGNHRYAWTLQKRDRKFLPASLPYPKLHA